MLSTSFLHAVTLSLLLGADVVCSVPLETTYCELQLDRDRCDQRGLTPTEVGCALKRFVKDKRSYKLSDLQNVSVTSRITGRTHQVKELGADDGQFSRIQPTKGNYASEELGKTERAEEGSAAEEKDVGEKGGGVGDEEEIGEEKQVTTFGIDIHVDLDKSDRRGVTPTEVTSAVKQFFKDKDSYELSDVQNLGVTSRTTGKTYSVKELGDVDVQFTLVRREEGDRAKEEPGKTDREKKGKSRKKGCRGQKTRRLRV